MYSIHCATPCGTIAIAWRPSPAGPRIVGLKLPPSAALASATTGEPSVALAVANFFQGGPPLPFGQIDLSGCGPFQQRVLEEVHRIPRGRVATYGMIARSVGSPGATRAVGSACAGNPIPLLIPCHRVVRADGTLGGYAGGAALKRLLLAWEGVAFDATIDLVEFAVQPRVCPVPITTYL